MGRRVPYDWLMDEPLCIAKPTACQFVLGRQGLWPG